jgi:hypothetical protein
MRAVLLGLVSLGVGCSLVRTPLVEPDGGLGLDAPVRLDVPGLDAPGPDDAPMVLEDVPAMRDTPASCVDGMRCVGDVLQTCSGGTLTTRDCALDGEYCEAGACMPQVCAPGSVECTGATQIACDARGASQTSTDCARGCTDGTGCNPETTCALAVAGAMGVGSRTVTTCGAGDDAVHQTGCTRTDRTGADLIVRLEVPVRADYRIDVVEMDSSDPVLYLRTACADQASELACDDDAGPDLSSRIEITLDPGDYFLMIDSFRDSEGPDGRCGTWNVTVATL